MTLIQNEEISDKSIENMKKLIFIDLFKNVSLTPKTFKNIQEAIEFIHLENNSNFNKKNTHGFKNLKCLNTLNSYSKLCHKCTINL